MTHQSTSDWAFRRGLFGKAGIGHMHRWMLMLALAWVHAVIAVTSCEAVEPVLPTVPPGFEIELIASAPVIERPVMANFDEQGRLYVVDSAGSNDPFNKLQENPPHRIVVLEDTDGDGRFDKRTLFADKLVMPQGVLPYRGKVYVASPPSVWMLEDTDHDGVCDQRTELVTKFGSNGNAADVHGPTLGLDGRLYLCDGRHGHKVARPDGTFDEGLAAGIFRFRTDGSQFERICGGGFDNPVEIDFTPGGDLLGTVNLLHGNPRQDCLMHWVEGGCYPRADQEQCLSEFQRTGDLLPAMTELGHVAVSGMTRWQSPGFGNEYDGNLFVTLFNLHKVIRSVVQPQGSTYRSHEEEFLISSDPDFHPTDVLQDGAGGLLVVNTGGWFRIGCPNSQVAKPDHLGAIYRVRKTGQQQAPDPFGRSWAFEKLPAEQLSLWLDDARPKVRERAIDELALRGAEALPVLQQVIESKPRTWSAQAREGAVWALCRIADTLPKSRGKDAKPLSSRIGDSGRIVLTRIGDLLIRAARDADPQVRMAAAAAIGVLSLSAGVEELSHRVTGDQPAVQRVAATSLGRLRISSQSTDVPRALAALLQPFRQDPPDRMLEHALIYATIRIGRADLLAGYLEDDSPLVRRAALIALDQILGKKLSPEQITPLLATDHEGLRTTALVILGKHPQTGQILADLVTRWLADAELTEERLEVLRGVLLAQLKSQEIRDAISTGLSSVTLPPRSRQLLWDVVHQSQLEPLPPAWRDLIKVTLDTPNSNERPRVLAILQDRTLPEFDELLLPIARAEEQPLELRRQALTVIAPRQPVLEAWMFDQLIAALTSEPSPLARIAFARALGDSRLSNDQLIALATALPKAGPLATARLLPAYRRSADEAVGQALLAALGTAALDEQSAARDLPEILANYPAAVRDQARVLLARLQTGDVAAQRERLKALGELASGGDVGRGKSLFFSQKAACGSCHAIGNLGNRVGPDLSKIGGIRTGPDLLEAIVYPSASFARDFRPYTITTTAGKVFTGIMSRQTPDTIILRTAELAELRIPRDTIEELVESQTSIMPKGIETSLTADELRDLLAYLQSLK